MGTALATLANKFVAMAEANSNPWIEAGEDAGFFGSFLKFSGNDGRFSYGKKDEEDYLEDGHELIANLLGVQHGHICWVDGKAVDEINVLVMEQPKLPSIDSLPNYGPYKKYQDGSEDGWQEQVVLQLYSPALDQAFTFKASGGGKLRAARQLISTFGKKGLAKIGKDGMPMFPVIEIGANGFQLKDNPKAGTKYAPILKIVDYEEMSNFIDIFEGKDGGDDSDDESNYEDAPAAAPARRAAPAQVEDKRAAAPARAAAPSRAAAPARRAPVQEPAPDVEDAEYEDVPAEEAEAPVEQAAAPSRRARVVHAQPQDEEEVAAETESRRNTARGRRGRG